MAVIISLLRGVNVGGHHKIKMDELRALYGSLQLRDAQTYIQSGNVVFQTAERDLVRLAGRIETAIEKKFGFRPEVINRTCAEMKEVIARNPFAGRREIEPNKLLVLFLSTEPDAEARKALQRIKTDPEELRVGGREVYVYYANGMARPVLPPALIEKTLKTSGTGRNWNSVTKLLEMAEKMEARPATLKP